MDVEKASSLRFTPRRVNEEFGAVNRVLNKKMTHLEVALTVSLPGVFPGTS